MARVSIEDCLVHMDNRFALVKVAAQRARELSSGGEPLIKTKNKECVTALREIADGIVVQEGETTENLSDSLVMSAPKAPVAAETGEEAATNSDQEPSSDEA